MEKVYRVQHSVVSPVERKMTVEQFINELWIGFSLTGCSAEEISKIEETVKERHGALYLRGELVGRLV